MSPRRHDGREAAKIAAIGVKVNANGVSRHGFALNVNPDKSYWDGIIGCGLVGHAVASLDDLLKPVPSMDVVVNAVIPTFGNIYNYEMCEELMQIATDSV